MPSSPIGSTLGNMVATRQRLSAIRQRLNLESPSGGKMRELAPSPANGPAPVRGHAQRAVQEEPDIDFDNYPIPPEKESAMMERIQGWIDENNNGIDDRTEGGQSPKSQVISDERVTRALSPLASFFQQNGRMPSPEDLQQVAARRTVRERLGRDPTDDEVNLYMTPPDKGMAMKRSAPNA